MTNIGFIGLGHMGKPMSLRLLKAGHPLFVYDVAPAATKALKENKAHVCKTLKEVADACDIIFASVQTGAQVKEVCLSKDGIFANAKNNLLFIDCSSIDIAITRALHTEARSKNISMLDAPVSGGVKGAEEGTLTIMVGGEASDFKKAEPYLSTMGKKIVHAGDAGSGQAAKICNNLLLGISMIGVCEAFNLAKKLGLNQKKFYEISSNASGQCWSMTSYCPVPGILDNVPSNRHYQPGFMANMMLKDLKLGMHAAELTHTVTPLGAVATELYTLYVNEGHGEKDFSGIINMLDAANEE